MRSMPVLKTERDENQVPIAPELEFTLPPIPDSIEAAISPVK